MREIFEKVFAEYVNATSEQFTQHELANFVRGSAPKIVKSVLANRFDELLVKGSCGQSRWADIPWISILDPLVTTSTLKGYYIVYLFSSDMSICYLCLGQGVTAVEEEFGAKQGVGNTCCPAQSVRLNPAHPHVRREHLRINVDAIAYRGSSPRA